MTLAIVGDVHGKLQRMYTLFGKNTGAPADTILQVGDFHAIRNDADLRQFPAPEKHRALGDFPMYVREGGVPLPTYFIGGNHENFYWLNAYPEGATILPNLHYLGKAGHKTIAGLEVAWLSGVYSPTNIDKGASPAHFTRADLEKVKSVPRADILLLHEWPSIEDIMNHGRVSDPSKQDVEQLIRRKTGSHDLFSLVESLKPKYVFCGHMHTPLDATIDWGESKTEVRGLAILGRMKSVYRMDPSTKKITSYGGLIGDLYSIVPSNDRTILEKAAAELRNGNAVAARTLYDSLSSASSSESRLFSHYGAGLCELHDYVKGTAGPEVVSSAVNHLRMALDGMSFADGHAVLGTALLALSMSPEGMGTFLDTVKEAAKRYESAAQLDKKYGERSLRVLRFLSELVAPTN